MSRRNITIQHTAWLDKLPQLLPNLKNLELQFHTNLLSAAWCTASDPFGARQFATFFEKFQSKHPVSTTFGYATFPERMEPSDNGRRSRGCD